MSAGVVALCELDVDASVGDPGHGKRRHEETMRHWITSFQFVADARDYDWRPGFASQDGKPLAQVIFRVTGRAVLELAKHPSKSRIVAEVDFEKNGRQQGFLRLFHSVHSSAYGFIPLPIVVLKNGDGPTALLVSGTHGDEYEGQVALCNLVKSLDPARIHGRVIILPAANFPAAMAGRRTSPIDEGNLNRLFPGDADGTVTEQIAYYIEHELVPMADLVCDLHSGGSSLMYVPSALFGGWQRDGSTAEGVAALKAFGAPIAYVGGEPIRAAS